MILCGFQMWNFFLHNVPLLIYLLCLVLFKPGTLRCLQCLYNLAASNSHSAYAQTLTLWKLRETSLTWQWEACRGSSHAHSSSWISDPLTEKGAVLFSYFILRQEEGRFLPSAFSGNSPVNKRLSQLSQCRPWHARLSVSSKEGLFCLGTGHPTQPFPL